ncbi:Hypothetical protein POVR1_LOCUS476 [uncultured virus]|nr:Hypothetical protein POVR1_LOCUS476 [uncultured virus]
MAANNKSLYECLTQDKKSYASWVYDKLFSLALHEKDLSSAYYLILKKDVNPFQENNQYLKLAVRVGGFHKLKRLITPSNVCEVIREAILHAQWKNLELILSWQVLDIEEQDEYGKTLAAVYDDIQKDHREKILEIFADRLGGAPVWSLLRHAVETSNSEMLIEVLKCRYVVISQSQVDQLKNIADHKITTILDQYVMSWRLKAKARELFDQMSDDQLDAEKAFIAGYLAGQGCNEFTN